MAKQTKSDGLSLIDMRIPLTKAERQIYVEKIRDQILEGNLDPLRAFIILQGIEDTIEQIRKEIKYYVMNEAQKYGTKTFDHSGVTIQLSERRMFDFKSCGDSYWLEQKKKEADAKEELKKREEFLRAIPHEGVATPDGEIIRSASFTTTEIISIKFK